MTALRDPEQRQRALQLANDVRTHVSEFKRELAALPQHEALMHLIDAIENRHGEKLLGAARVRYLLLSVDHIGDVKARALLTTAQIFNYDKRLRELTPRQRKLLVDLLEHQCWRAT